MFNKVYYHSDNFRDASAEVNLPRAVGHPNAHLNGHISVAWILLKIPAVVGEDQFLDESGALGLAFPGNGTQRKV